MIVFGALSVAVTAYQSAGFGGTISAPAGTDSAAGTDLLNKYFPVTAANPTNLVYKLSDAGLAGRRGDRDGDHPAAGGRCSPG